MDKINTHIEEENIEKYGKDIISPSIFVDMVIKSKIIEFCITGSRSRKNGSLRGLGPKGYWGLLAARSKMDGED